MKKVKLKDLILVKLDSMTQAQASDLAFKSGRLVIMLEDINNFRTLSKEEFNAIFKSLK